MASGPHVPMHGDSSGREKICKRPVGTREENPTRNPSEYFEAPAPTWSPIAMRASEDSQLLTNSNALCLPRSSHDDSTISDDISSISSALRSAYVPPKKSPPVKNEKRGKITKSPKQNIKCPSCNKTCATIVQYRQHENSGRLSGPLSASSHEIHRVSN